MRKEQIAIYMRLSKEDDITMEERTFHEEKNFQEESNSISTQRILLKRYVAEHFSEYELLEFQDDGYTGTNFDRPGIQRLLELVREVKIDCIVVKDFSRFSRDYIELGSYLEQIFPFMGVRFISVNDQYDSTSYKGGIADLDINFKNLLYDLYSKDLSQKVRSSLAARKKKGQYVSAHAPFGYEKDPNDRHMLLIEEDEAKIIRKIFSLTLEGYTSSQIAKLFNKERIKTPVEFKVEKGKTTRFPKGNAFMWNNTGICQILNNPIYAGDIVQGKTTKEFVGGKNRLNPREEWITYRNHHKAIIEREIFEKVQESRGKKKTPQYNETPPLVGKLVCGCCSKNLGYKRSANPYFTCKRRYSTGLAGCVDKVNGVFIEQYILFYLQEKLTVSGEATKLIRENISNIHSEIEELKRKKRVLSEKHKRLEQEQFEKYQQYALRETESFHNDDSMIQSIINKIKCIEQSIQHLEEKYDQLMSMSKKSSVEGSPAVLSKELLDRYIKRIVVNSEQDIKIEWVLE